MKDGTQTNVTAVILAKNEERAIKSCIESLRGLVDEVIVVDSNSEDETAAIARLAGARVVPFTWNGRYPKKKEWSLRNTNVATDWVLLLDADERVGPALCQELPALVRAGASYSAYDIPLKYYWRGHELHHGQTVYKRSLLQPAWVSFPELPDLDAEGITEVEGHYQPEARGAVGLAVGQLLHDDPDPVHDWYARHNRYSDWEAYLRLNPEARRAVFKYRSPQGRLFERLPLKPLVIFVYNYIVRNGWRDGRHGFEYALSLAFYQFQISVKVRELEER